MKEQENKHDKPAIDGFLCQGTPKFILVQADLYERMCMLAQLTEDQIEDEARNVYRTKGLFGIDINFHMDTDYIDETVRVRVSADEYTKGGKRYFLAMGQKKKFVMTARDCARRVMEKQFGKVIDDHNRYVRLRKKAIAVTCQLAAWTVIGWIAAIVLLVKTLCA